MNNAQAVKFLVTGVNEYENIEIEGRKYEKVRVIVDELETDEFEERYYVRGRGYSAISGYHSSIEKAITSAKEKYGSLFDEKKMFYYRDITPDPDAIDWSKYL